MKNAIICGIGSGIVSFGIATVIMFLTNKDLLVLAAIELMLHALLFSLSAGYMDLVEIKRRENMISKKGGIKK